jgi:hypothetical protein
MWPLDLIKDLIAWVGDKLGFDTTKLKEFSFSDMWKMISDKFIDGVMSVVRFVKAIAVGIGAGIAALWPGGEGPMEAFKRAFDETMAKPSGKKAATIEKPEKGTGEKMQEEKVRLDEQKASGRRRLSKGMQEELAARDAARKGGGNVVGINVKNEGSQIHLDGTSPEEKTADNDTTF